MTDGSGRVEAKTSPSQERRARERRRRANLQEAWAALAMIREAVETLGPSGAMKAAEHLDGPTLSHEADAIVEGIRALAAVKGEPAQVERPKGPNGFGCVKPYTDRQVFFYEQAADRYYRGERTPYTWSERQPGFDGRRQPLARIEKLAQGVTLLPCPFCGSPARTDLLPHAGGPGWVQCSECELTQHMSDTLEEAVKRWNTRAALSQGGSSDQKSAPAVRSSLPSGESDPSVTLDCAGADTAFGRLTKECVELRAQVKRQWKPSDKELAEWALECSDEEIPVSMPGSMEAGALTGDAPVASVSTPIAAALARRLCQFFDSGGESQRSARARHASAIFQLLNRDDPAYQAEQARCDADPVGYLERAEQAAQVERTSLDAWIDEAALEAAQAIMALPDRTGRPRAWKVAAVQCIIAEQMRRALSQGGSSDQARVQQQGNLYSGDFAAEFMETIWEGCAYRDCLPKCRTNDGHCERLKLEYDEWLQRAPSLASAERGGVDGT